MEACRKGGVRWNAVGEGTRHAVGYAGATRTRARRITVCATLRYAALPITMGRGFATRRRGSSEAVDRLESCKEVGYGVRESGLTC